MRFLFVSAQLPGHLDWGGYLKTATALRQRGHEILWVSGKEVEPIISRAEIPFASIDQTGWRWPPPPPLSPTATADPIKTQQLRAERALDQWLDAPLVRTAVTQLEEVVRAFHPDVLISENFTSAAGIVAERLEIPFVVAGWPAAQVNVTPDNQIIVEMGRKRLDVLLEEFQVSGKNWTNAGPAALLSPMLHLTYWSPSWFHGMALLAQTEHVGGIHTPFDLATADPAILEPTSRALLENPQIAETPWVFITLGTSFNDDVNFFVAASHAADELGATPILALGRKPSKATLAELNAKAARSSILTDRVHFDQILPTVGAAIHHGGAGTTHALVTHAVPQILVPHAADQMHQVHGASRSGVGVGIRPQHVTIDGLAQILEEMLVEESRFQTNAHNIQAEFAKLGGVQRAADLLETLI